MVLKRVKNGSLHTLFNEKSMFSTVRNRLNESNSIMKESFFDSASIYN